jgi:hypothetical protein
LLAIVEEITCQLRHLPLAFRWLEKIPTADKTPEHQIRDDEGLGPPQ